LSIAFLTIKGNAKDQPPYRMIQSVDGKTLIKQAANYFRLDAADLTRKRVRHRQETSSSTPGTPKDRMDILQEAMRKIFKDPEFRAEFKLVTDDVSPLMPEELTKIIKEMPRDPEVTDLLKKFSGIDPLPPR
jgi:hypothetical protein